MVVPVNKIVRVQVIGADVIHAFAVPSFGIKIDAIPGRLNETWFKATKEGVYYGQCSELCGKDHAFMPIAVRVVSEQAFADMDRGSQEEIRDANGGADQRRRTATRRPSRPAALHPRPRPPTAARTQQGPQGAKTMDTHATAHDAHDDAGHGHPTGWRRLVYSTNHKDIGTMYLVFAIMAGVIGGLLSIAMRMELQHPGMQIFTTPTPSTCSPPRTA